MLCDYFYLYQFITEGLNIPTRVINVDTSTSTHSDIIYKTEGSSNENSDKDTSDMNPSDNNDGASEEESFEIEEEIADIKRLMKLSNNAMILDERLPDSQKDKNRYLNDLRKDPNVKEFFEGKTPNISDLPELNQSLIEARADKIRELSEAKSNNNSESYPKYKSYTDYLRDRPNSNLRDTNNTLNKDYKDYKDYNYDSDYKIPNSLLDYIIDILKDIFS